MKATIHPKVQTSRVLCNCGNTFITESTNPEIHVEVCYKCHPFFTGEQRFVDVKGRVETFKKKMAVAAQIKDTNKNKKDKKNKQTEHQTKSLRELLGQS